MNTIFITGASSGLGKATAKLFGSKGWQVIATMRQPENEKELTLSANVKLLQLDVMDTNSIKMQWQQQPKWAKSMLCLIMPVSDLPAIGRLL